MKSFINKIGIIFFMTFIFGIMSFRNVYAEGKWTEKAPLPYTFGGGNAVVSNGKIYVVGGLYNSSYAKRVLEYDPTTDTWTEKAPIPTSRCYLAVTEMNGKIYAIGGRNPESPSSTVVEEYDVAKNIWTKKSSMNIGRREMNATTMNGKLYVFGGIKEDGHTAKDFEEYDPITDKWTVKGDMIEARCYYDIAKIGNTIYLIGGFNDLLEKNGLISYNTITDKWSKLSEMSTGRTDHETVVIEGKIYAMGGLDKNNSMSKEIEKYDPITNSWSYEGNLPMENGNFSSVELNGKIYMIGGETSKGYTNKVYEYDAGSTPNTSLNLKASVENSSIVLSWDKVDKATGYNVKRSLTAGGPYTTIASDVKENTYTDKDVQVDTKYYYVVTPIVDGKEGAKTNEASAIVTKNGEQPNENVGNGILNVTMTNGIIKEYDLSMTEINDFINWYNGRAEGKGTISYCIKKNANIKPFNNRKEYLVFDKIYSFEVNEYDNK